MDVRGPLVGRGAELEAIETALHRAGEGTRPDGAVVVSGAQGMGKTRILRTVAERARTAGRTVEFAAATRACASIPLGPLSHLTAGQALAGRQGDGRPHVHATQLHTVATRLTGGRPKRDVLVVVDDAHLLDPVSAAFVHHLVLHDLATVVIAIAPGPHRPEDGSTADEVPDAVVALWKDDLATRVELRPLTDAATEELLGHALPGGICGLTRVRLRALAAGNPLYLRELLIAGAESGALRREDRLWCWTGPLRGAWRVGELVGGRLGAAGPAARAVLELLACGEPLPLTMLDHDIEGLIAAEKAGLVDVVADGRRAVVRLSQPLYGEVLRAGLGVARTRAVYRDLAERMARCPPRRRDDMIRLTGWQVASGAAPAPAASARAARHAMARHDPERAERLARGAADTGGPREVVLLAGILCERGRPAESAALLAPGPPAGLPAAQRARWLAVEAKTLFFGLGRQTDAARALTEARRAVSRPVPGLEVLHAGMLLYQGRVHAALAAALPVCSAPDAPTASRVRAYGLAVLACAFSGMAAEAVRLADEAAPPAGDAARPPGAYPGPRPARRPHLGTAHVLALVFCGRLADGWEVADRGYREAITTADSALVGAWAAVRGLTARMRGDLPVAAASLREAVACTRRHDPDGIRRVQMSMLAGTLAMTGDPEAAEWMRRADEEGGPAFALYAPLVGLDRAWVATLTDPARAAALATRAAAAAGRAGQFTVEALALHDAALFGAAREVWPRLREVAALCDARLVDALAQHAAALAKGDGRRLEAAAATFDGLGASLLASEALVAAARAHLSAGDPSRAAGVRERARVSLGRCPGARTPGLSAGGAADFLTPRERDIATLAAKAMSSSDIARRLHISTRTVNNHLGRVYAKLGVTGRGELTALLCGEGRGR